MKYGDALQDLVSQLDAGGITATTELATLQLPGALVVPGTLQFEYLDPDNYSANVDVYLLVADHGSIESMNDAQDLLTKFRAIFKVLEAEPIALPAPNHGADPLPGFLVTLALTITKD